MKETGADKVETLRQASLAAFRHYERARQQGAPEPERQQLKDAWMRADRRWEAARRLMVSELSAK